MVELAVKWLLYDKKDTIKLITPDKYPFKIKNYSTKEKICNNKEELWKHLVTDTNENIPVITRIVPINPNYFIDEDLLQIISQYVRFKNYGINFLYPNWDEIPNVVLEIFDYISSEISKHEKKLMEKPSKVEKVTKPGQAQRR